MPEPPTLPAHISVPLCSSVPCTSRCTHSDRSKSSRLPQSLPTQHRISITLKTNAACLCCLLPSLCWPICAPQLWLPFSSEEHVFPLTSWPVPPLAPHGASVFSGNLLLHFPPTRVSIFSLHIGSRHLCLGKSKMGPGPLDPQQPSTNVPSTHEATFLESVASFLKNPCALDLQCFCYNLLNFFYAGSIL